jgi:hypothetical protein
VAVLAGGRGTVAWLAAGAALVQVGVWLWVGARGWHPDSAGEVLAVVTALGLATRPPARHGLRLLGRRRFLLVVALVPVLDALRAPLAYAHQLLGVQLRLPTDLRVTPWEPQLAHLPVLLLVALLGWLVVRRAGGPATGRLAALATPPVAVAVLLPGIDDGMRWPAGWVLAVVVAAVAFAAAVAALAGLERLVHLLRLGRAAERRARGVDGAPPP